MTIERFVEQRAARVVVVVVLAVESFFVEQDAVDRLDDPLDIGRAFEPSLDRAAPRTDLLEVVIDVDAWILFERDDERRFDEIEQRFGATGDFAESLPCESRTYEWSAPAGGS